MQLRYKFEFRCQLDPLRHSLDSVKILFQLGVGGKITPRIRLTSAKDLVEVEAELGNSEGGRFAKVITSKDSESESSCSRMLNDDPPEDNDEEESDDDSDKNIEMLG